ncbi:membrane-spanning 4-domains subfamily A member 12 isoform X2 [Mus musculus]|uniref:membrane-spanning 4-domains subfamily A member 12 isoform X2 n=1 Tax=Mus musculus TaxID=10090 RepID=UPI0003D6DFC4|nr:membrane-spanning 4-domains subfamily A member 12 isoform X2 [Mus musculus]|eukprot:XP_006527570.1 PREDICTED: membrane-spanning 4-domains subfamily A member 12 isoform X3 [Mus musculus]
MTSSQTTYPGTRGIPNPCPPTRSMAPHPPQPLNFLNVRNQVQTGQVSFITSPGIFPNTQLGRENVPTVNPALGAAISNVKDAAIALGMKSTLIINISSTIFAFVGVILFLCDLNINGYYYQDYWMVLSGRGIAGVLAIFSLLEFSIAGAMAYFAHQGILRCNRSVPVAPAVYVANPLMRESPSAPPIYDNIPDYATTQ